MTEQQVIDLNFEEMQSSGDKYYVYNLPYVTLIASNENIQEDEWVVEMLEAGNYIRFVDADEVDEFLRLLERNTMNE